MSQATLESTAPLPQLVLDPTTGHFLVVDDERRAFELMTSYERLLGEGEAKVVLPAAIIERGEASDDGVLVKALGIPWLAIARKIARDPDFLYQFVRYPRNFEEFLAGAYDEAGCPHVQLTPHSNDRGRDVIATWPGRGHVRIYDQAKAFAPHRKVTAESVRAMFGVINLNTNVSKAVVTTTAEFAPGVFEEFKSVMPYRLELKDGKQLAEWIGELASGRG